MTSVRKGVFCEPGKGDIDFSPIKADMEKIRYEGWIVVEQDSLPGMGKAKESARRAREELASIRLKSDVVHA